MQLLIMTIPLDAGQLEPVNIVDHGCLSDLDASAVAIDRLIVPRRTSSAAVTNLQKTPDTTLAMAGLYRETRLGRRGQASAGAFLLEEWSAPFGMARISSSAYQALSGNGPLGGNVNDAADSGDKRGLGSGACLIWMFTFCLIFLACMVPTLQPLAFDGGGKHNIFIGGNKVFGWGLNDFGQLCPKTKRINKSPVRLRVGNPIMAAAGQKHTLYLYADGSIKSCGRNKWGQLGNGTTSDARQLVSVPGINEVVSIADGGHHSLAITADGILYAWGRNKEGQLCDTADGTAVTMPQEVNIGGITEAAAGDHHTLLLRQGQIWACGLDDHGQLGLESVTPPQFPAPIDGLPDVLAVATGGEHSLAVVADSQGNNRLYTWGRNTFGQLCLGDLEDRDIPTPTQITGISKIDGEGPFSAILLEDGRVLTCGWGMFGGANPRDITEGSDIAQVVDMTAGHYTVHIWDNLGRVFGMGGNDYGQVGDGTRRARWNLVKIGTVN